MSTTRQAHPRARNTALAEIIIASGASHKSLAARVNAYCSAWGNEAAYTHTSVANWIAGMTPRWPAPKAIAAALSERLGRQIRLTDIGMPQCETPSADIGLDFPREPAAAVDSAARWWTFVKRRDFLDASAFAAAAFTTPVSRWLITPADRDPEHSGRRRVGMSDIGELREAAEHARRWDSRYGGGSSASSQVVTCLHERAAPLLRGTYSPAAGRELFSVTAQLGRLAGYSAWDMARNGEAQRHYIQALRLARAAGDIPLGGYVLACMALQACLRDFHDEAIDMAQGAFERARRHATPRTLAFFALIEARTHARAGDRRAAALALARSENLLEKAKPGDADPGWIDFFTHARLAADATEIHRDLAMPHMVMRFENAATMPPDIFTRSVGMRRAIVASGHLQARRLDEGLALGHQAITILGRVASRRSLDYVRDFLTRLDPWNAEEAVKRFRLRARRELGISSRDPLMR